jgi:hypothetical protein
LRVRFRAGIAGLTEHAETTDAAKQPDPRVLQADIARREDRHAKLDAAF